MKSIVKKAGSVVVVLILLIGALLVYSYLQEGKRVHDYRNFYAITWYGTACDNLDYAKTMGYDYVMYQDGMQKCANWNGTKFYLESPDTKLIPSKAWQMCQTSSFSSSEIEQYNKMFSQANLSKTFPNNLVTGWYFGTNCFRPILDFQQQTIIDQAVTAAINKAKSIEATGNVEFVGWMWDVPSLEADLWSSR
jgi:hypothetical protein